jgi:hypothetical protein
MRVACCARTASTNAANATRRNFCSRRHAQELSQSPRGSANCRHEHPLSTPEPSRDEKPTQHSPAQRVPQGRRPVHAVGAQVVYVGDAAGGAPGPPLVVHSLVAPHPLACLHPCARAVRPHALTHTLTYTPTHHPPPTHPPAHTLTFTYSAVYPHNHPHTHAVHPYPHPHPQAHDVHPAR